MHSLIRNIWNRVVKYERRKKKLIFATKDSDSFQAEKFIVTLSITGCQKCFSLRYIVIGTSRWLLPFHVHGIRDQRNACTLDSKELIDNFYSDSQVMEYVKCWNGTHSNEQWKHKLLNKKGLCSGYFGRPG